MAVGPKRETVVKLKLRLKLKRRSQDATSPERIRRRPFCIMLLPPILPRRDRGRPAIIGVSRDELALEIPRARPPWWQLVSCAAKRMTKCLLEALGQGGLDMSELNASRGRLRGCVRGGEPMSDRRANQTRAGQATKPGTWVCGCSRRLIKVTSRPTAWPG